MKNLLGGSLWLGLFNTKLLSTHLAFSSRSRSSSSSISSGVNNDNNNNNNNNKDFPSVVVFGRPGAGKTTVANAAVEKLETAKNDDDDDSNVACLGLDLDVVVPSWMKENFAKGIYPTLPQRESFAEECCDYVEAQLDAEQQKYNDQTMNVATIVSFSFVNTDLRDVFRGRFPNAEWVLIDTNDDEATRRINEREDHFYKGGITSEKEKCKSDDSGSDENDNDEKDEDKDVDIDNSDWNFAPVTFPHTSLAGDNSVDTNAKKVLDVLLKKIDDLS